MSINQWVSVKDQMPQIDEKDEWKAKTRQSIECWTYSYFGLKQGRYYYPAGFWTIDGCSSSSGIEVTHWMPIPEPPNTTP